VIRKYIRLVMSMIFTIICAMMILCLLLVVKDYKTKVCTGEFQIFPLLNISQFRIKDDGAWDKEDDKILVDAVAYLEQIYWSGHTKGNPLWQFLNLSTIFALVNLLLYHILYYFKLRFSRFISATVWIEGIIALILIVAIRIYCYNCIGRVRIEDQFSVAYLPIGRFWIPTIIFIGFTNWRKHTKNMLSLYNQSR